MVVSDFSRLQMIISLKVLHVTHLEVFQVTVIDLKECQMNVTDSY